MAPFFLPLCHSLSFTINFIVVSIPICFHHLIFQMLPNANIFIAYLFDVVVLFLDFIVNQTFFFLSRSAAMGIIFCDACMHTYKPYKNTQFSNSFSGLPRLRMWKMMDALRAHIRTLILFTLWYRLIVHKMRSIAFTIYSLECNSVTDTHKTPIVHIGHNHPQATSSQNSNSYINKNVNSIWTICFYIVLYAIPVYVNTENDIWYLWWNEESKRIRMFLITCQ